MFLDTQSALENSLFSFKILHALWRVNPKEKYMKSYIDASVKVFESTSNIEVYTNLITANYSEVISSNRWLEISEGIKNQNKGKCVLSKIFKDKPAKLFQWQKMDDEKLMFEIFISSNEKDWSFKHDFVMSLTDLEAFVLIHSYSMGIMKMLKQEIADKVLADTTFLSREQQ